MQVLIHVAAQQLGLSARTLDNWARTGRIKFTRSAGGWRLFDGSEIARVRARLAEQAKVRGK